MQEVLLPVHQLRKLALSVTGFALLLAMIIATVATQRITQPILTLTRLAIRIAQGDLSDIRLPKLPDNEIGLLASAIATMAYNLKDLVSKVKSSSSQIVRLYGATSQASKTQTDAALRAVQASAKISEVAQDIATTAKDLFSTIEAINQTIQKTAFQAEFSRNRLKIIASTIHEIVKAKDMIGQHLSDLKDKALSIQSIFGSIVKIADRTNILSLNTAIEAQQLGKNSSGLRVIAREIKQLADQTCMSSVQIEKKIQEMDSAVRLGIAGMDQFSEKVNQETQEITNASVYLNQLIEAVAKLPHHIEKAFARMQFQIQSAEAIEESIERLCASAHQAAVVLQETNQNLEDLNKSSGTFQKEIARFKT
jgi:methyl-accepting chemotaxis protein WspA